MRTMEKNQPLKKIRAGAICATIWQNKQNKDGKEFTVPSISLDRRYTDKSGAWQSTNSMRASDLPKAALVLTKAYEFLTLEKEGTSPLFPTPPYAGLRSEQSVTPTLPTTGMA
ncbi:hypothetical protein HY641_03970 [Candidatus Woesearchaeota archaeon]|nr:hypothetical protein [Candidatus Woesearchaeota archaeon]